MRTQSIARAMILTVALAALAPVLAACNTTAGAGRDVSAAGQAVTRSANDVKHDM
jgi:entericidin B